MKSLARGRAVGRCPGASPLLRRQTLLTPSLRWRAPPPRASEFTPLEPIFTRDVGFPYSNDFLVDGKPVDAATVVRLLEPFALDERVKRIREVVTQRTFNVFPIVEGLYDMGNLAAVCRTADALGYGVVHAINKADLKYKCSQRIAAGADKWLDVKVWDSTKECLTAAKAAGYQIVTTHLSPSSVTIQEIDWTKPTAFVLGNEKFGVSKEAVAASDACAVIPMTGMVESLNVSVASALILYEAQQQRIRRLGSHADLTEDEQMALRAVLLGRSVKEVNMVLSEMLARPPPKWQRDTFKRLSKDSRRYEATARPG